MLSSVLLEEDLAVKILRATYFGLLSTLSKLSTYESEETYSVLTASHTVEKEPSPSLRITLYLPLQNVSPRLTGLRPPGR